MTKFLREAFNRLKTKSPKFFFVLQLVAGSATMASSLPGVLDRWTNLLIADWFVNICNDVAKYAAGFLAATLLSAESKPTAVTEEGDVLKKLDDKRYPYTSSVEQKKASRDEVPVVKDPLTA